MKREPTISIIIPTHNRSTSLRRMLDVLCTQTYPLQEMETIVVADGCTDGTVDMLQQYKAPFALRVVAQPGQGAARARNRGAADAVGRLLLFLDDDVEPTPPLVEAHVRTHQRQPAQVVMGHCPPALQEPLDFFRMELRAWWCDQFRTMGQPGHRYTYRDLLSGNLSIEADLFARVGGFDPAFRSSGGEDSEFGLRLVKAGVPFVFAADALAYHHETSDLDRSLRRVRQEGRSDVLIGRRHPELRPTLRLAYIEAPGPHLSHMLRSRAFKRPAAGDVLAARIRRVLDLLEWARLCGRWRHFHGQLRDYWYWRGVAEELGTRRALTDFLQSGPARADEDAHEIELDLREGLEAAERRLDEERPAGVRLRYGQQPVGRIAPEPGAERLRGVHLRPSLATQHALSLLMALAVETAIGSVTAPALYEAPAIGGSKVSAGPTPGGKGEPTCPSKFSTLNCRSR